MTIKLNIIIVMVLMLGLGCAPSTPLEPTVMPVTPKVISKAQWEEDWDKTVAAAKNEGKLVIYTTSGPEVRTALDKAFKEKFGIDIEFVTGRGPEITAKIFAERNAGLYLSDFYIGGTTTPVGTWKPAGILAPTKPLFLLPELLDPDPKVWWNGKIPYSDTDEQYVALFVVHPYAGTAINTGLVKPGELKSVKDLLAPRWKGKIVMGDPTISGSAGKWAQTMGQSLMGWDFMKELSKQVAFVSRDERLLTEWVARGKYSLVIGVKTDPVTEFKKAGAPINFIDFKETFVSAANGAICFFDKAPHPNASKIFLNWLFTKEGLTIFSQAGGSCMARLDVPNEHIVPELRLDPNIEYFMSDREDIIMTAEEAYKIAKEIFGHLLK